MRMLKTFLCVLLAAVMLLSVASCGIIGSLRLNGNTYESEAGAAFKFEEYEDPEFKKMQVVFYTEPGVQYETIYWYEGLSENGTMQFTLRGYRYNGSDAAVKAHVEALNAEVEKQRTENGGKLSVVAKVSFEYNRNYIVLDGVRYNKK